MNQPQLMTYQLISHGFPTKVLFQDTPNGHVTLCYQRKMAFLCLGILFDPGWSYLAYASQIVVQAMIAISFPLPCTFDRSYSTTCKH